MSGILQSWPLEAAQMARWADRVIAPDLVAPADPRGRDLARVIWLQVGAAANAVLGDYRRTVAFVIEHARLFAKLLADPHFEELTDASFEESGILLQAWQKLMLFRGAGADMARECLDPENDSRREYAFPSFPAFIALARGSTAEFAAHVDAEVRSAEDQFGKPPTKVSFFGLNATILLGMAPASDALLAQQYGLPAAPSWAERYQHWGGLLARHDP
jgi:hypothetical protein